MFQVVVCSLTPLHSSHTQHVAFLIGAQQPRSSCPTADLSAASETYPLTTHRPNLDRFAVGVERRELILYFSEGVAFSALELLALSLSSNETAISNGEAIQKKNASLSCASASRGRQGSRRELVLRLDEPCLTNNVSISEGDNSTFSDVNSSYWEGGYSSDWNKLTEVGLLLETGTGGRVFLLNATADFVTDLSSAANDLVGVGHLEQSFPGTRSILIRLFVCLSLTHGAPPRVSSVPFARPPQATDSTLTHYIPRSKTP